MNVISDQSEKHTIFYMIVHLIIRLFNMHFAIQGLKMSKTKELSRDMRVRILERHKRGQGYRKISKEMNLALTTVGNIIRKYKKYGDGTAHLPRNGRPRKINERTSRWISRNVQINPFITRSEIKTDLEGARINVSKDTISRALYCTGFHSRSPRKVPRKPNMSKTD